MKNLTKESILGIDSNSSTENLLDIKKSRLFFRRESLYKTAKEN